MIELRGVEMGQKRVERCKKGVKVPVSCLYDERCVRFDHILDL